MRDYVPGTFGIDALDTSSLAHTPAVSMRQFKARQYYPVTKGRNIGIHRYLGTGKLPGEFLTIEEVQANADYTQDEENRCRRPLSSRQL